MTDLLKSELYSLITPELRMSDCLEPLLIDGACLIDLTGEYSPWISDSLLKTLGVTREDAEQNSKLWEQSITPRDLSAIEAYIDSSKINEQAPFERLVTFRTYQKKEFKFLTKGVVVREGDVPIRMILTHVDMTKHLVNETADSKAARYKSGLLEAVAKSISKLNQEDSWIEALRQGIALLGEAINVDRTYYFQNFTNTETGSVLTNQVLEWVRGEASVQIDNPDLQNLPFDVMFTDIAKALRNRKPYEAITSHIGNTHTRELLESQDIKTILMIPVFVFNEFYGIIGFDDCQNERVITDDERNIMFSFGETLGKSIELKQKHAALQESETKLRSVLDSSRDHHFLVAPDYTLININRVGVEELTYAFGKRPQVGDDYRAYVLQGFEEIFNNNFHRALGGHFVDEEHEVNFEDTIYWYLISYHPVFDEHCQVIAVSVKVSNITERKKSEAIIVESEIYHRSLLKTIPDLLFVLNRNGDYIDYKEDMHDLYAEPETFIGKNVVDVMPPELAQQILDAIRQTAETKELIEFPYDLVIKGETHHYIGRVMAFGDSKVIAAATDVSLTVKSMKHVETLLQQQEDQNKRLSNFTHIVSHNLRSHMANIQGLLSLIEFETPELLEQEYFKMLNNASHNLTETINHLNQVLDISLAKDEAWHKLNIAESIDSVVKTVSALTKNADINIQNNVDRKLSIKSIPAYFTSIVLNFTTNAIKYSSRDRESYLKISAIHTPQVTTLVFEDNGLGIDLKRHGEELFGMYKTFHTHKESKGLGLFITKNQIEALGGSIEVESSVDVGTTFSITLPNDQK